MSQLNMGAERGKREYLIHSCGALCSQKQFGMFDNDLWFWTPGAETHIFQNLWLPHKKRAWPKKSGSNSFNMQDR